MTAAYLFGSSAVRGATANDVDLLLLFAPDVDRDIAILDIASGLAAALQMPTDKFDLVLFDLQTTDAAVICSAVNGGLLIVDKDPEALCDAIEAVSRRLTDEEWLREEGKRLRREELEDWLGH